MIYTTTPKALAARRLRQASILLALLLAAPAAMQAQVSVPYTENFDSYTGTGVSANSEYVSSFSTRTKPTGWLFPFCYEGDSPDDDAQGDIWLGQAVNSTYGSGSVYPGSVTHLIYKAVSDGPAYSCLPTVSHAVSGLYVYFDYQLENSGTSFSLGIVSQAAIDAGNYADYTVLKEYTGTYDTWISVEEDLDALVSASSYSGSTASGGFRIVLQYTNTFSTNGFRGYVDNVVVSTHPCSLLPYSETFDTYTGTECSNGTACISSNTEPPTAYPNHVLPNCWDFPSMASSHSTSTSNPTLYHPNFFLTTSSSYRHSASNGLVFKSLKKIPAVALLPDFDVPASNLKVSFYYRMDNTSSAYTFQIGIVTDPDDTSTFVPLQTYTKTTTWTQAVVSLADLLASDYEAGTYRLAIRYYNPISSGYRGYIDDVAVCRNEAEEIYACACNSYT